VPTKNGRESRRRVGLATDNVGRIMLMPPQDEVLDAVRKATKISTKGGCCMMPFELLCRRASIDQFGVGIGGKFSAPRVTSRLG
jgi:hypothetical protein